MVVLRWPPSWLDRGPPPRHPGRDARDLREHRRRDRRPHPRPPLAP